MIYQLGLVGHPVEHSLSPPMHKAALAYFDLQGDYVTIDLLPEKIEQGLADLIKQKFTGFNVTIPHKRSFLKLASELTSDAEQSGAVNTVRINEQGRLSGHNTDIGGFMSALGQGYIRVGSRPIACILGSGGGARAALWGLARLGWSKVLVMARNEDASQELVEEAQSGFKKLSAEISAPKLQALSTNMTGLDGVPDLVVNATPIGLQSPDVPEWVAQLLKWMNPEGTLFDMVYSPTGESTALAKVAGKLRLNTIDGSEMLVQQAALAFHYWTNKNVPLQVMRMSLQEARAARRCATALHKAGV